MNIACLMMQKNKKTLIEPWLIYHGNLFGYPNIYVWDNGSTRKEIFPIIEKYAHKGVNFLDGARRHEKYKEKGVLFGNIIRNLERFKYYDFFIPIDCDEFICLAKTNENEIITDFDKIFEEFSRIEQDVSLVKIGYNFPNNIQSPGHFFGWEYDKKFVRSGAFLRMDHGGHYIETRNQTNYAESNLAFIHFCFRSYEEAKENALDKLILTPDVLSWPVEELSKHRFGKILTMSEEDYISSMEVMNKNKIYRASGLQNFFAKFGRSLPFS